MRNESVSTALLGCAIAPLDEHGNPVKRTRLTHPYNYDGFVLWRGGENGEATGTIYTDRLIQWDFDKHDELCVKHFGNRGQYWDQREPEKIEAFLRDWTGCAELRLILVMQYCNQATGYPTWRLDYYQPNAGGQRTAVAGTLDRPCSTGGDE